MRQTKLSAAVAKATKPLYTDKYNDETAQSSLKISRQRAEQITDRINRGQINRRRAIEAMFRGGCRALGLSFHQYAHTLNIDFRQVYREKDAAIVERRLGYDIGTIRESVLRLLTNVPVKPLNLLWDECLKILEESGSKEEFPTAKMVKEMMVEHGLLEAKGPASSEEVIKKIAALLDKLTQEGEVTEVEGLARNRKKVLIKKGSQRLSQK